MTSDFRLVYKYREPFQSFHFRKQRWSVIIAHRRAGKTVACLHDLLIRASRCKHGVGRYAYIAPYYVQAKSVAWDYLKAFARPLLAGPPNESELRVDLFNGARISLYGGDNQDRLRGLALDGVVLDEFADMPASLWGQVVRPALTDRKGWATIIGTVKGKNQLWETYQLGRQHPDEWFTKILRSSETGILDADELLDARRSMSEDQFSAEFECDPEAAIQGAYFGREMKDALKNGRIVDSLPLIDTDVCTAWDFGNGANMAVWCFQVGRDGPHVVDYISMGGKYFLDYLKEVRDRGYRGACYVPHDAKVPSFETGRTRIETMFEQGHKAVLVADHNVEDRIHAAKLTIPKTFFDAEKCASGLEALRQYQQEWDDKARVYKKTPKHDWASHPADAFGYLAMAWKQHIQPEIDKAAPVKLRGLSEITFNELHEFETGGYEKRERV
jgi:hypothetical protein